MSPPLYIEPLQEEKRYTVFRWILTTEDNWLEGNNCSVVLVLAVIGWLVPDARFQAPEVGMNYELDVGLMKPQSIEDSYQLVADASDITASEPIVMQDLVKTCIKLPRLSYRYSNSYN